MKVDGKALDKQKKTVELPYRITPNSIIYWNDHTGMPGIVTYQTKEIADEEFEKLTKGE
jgi:hypothetical protein